MLPFLNRTEEKVLISNALQKAEGQLIVVYGRRRCGKSRLLRELAGDRMLYFPADQREATLQRAALAGMLDTKLPGFSDVHYPDWEALFTNLHYRTASADAPIVLCIDEFPYLVGADAALPSIIQGFIDKFPARKVHLILAGSAQHMMGGLALDPTAPLYGRAREVLRIRPLAPYWLQEAVEGLSGAAVVEEYAVWGGVPRYWELRADFPDLASAIKSLVFSPFGILYEEPTRLFQDETRSATQLFSILSLIAGGCHRLSEIAARLEKPATQLSRPLALLQDLQYVSRDIPFGESEKTSKRGFYKIADPFLNFYFQVVVPYRSALESGQGEQIWRLTEPLRIRMLADIWERICRQALPKLLGDMLILPPQRWWQKDTGTELDMATTAYDRKTLVVGEVKWSDTPDVPRISAKLDRILTQPAFQGYPQVIRVLFSKSAVTAPGFDLCFSAEDVVSSLK
ncbi:MAG: ATP-binding protein [Saprospiraceae bacterium]|nr:ATP-binding protein [Saprospiraceae bacterium]